ncbi:MAG: hypothetical protein Q8K92_08820 [Leadbetterella sp.]|nr:hypothetical protein [Leadbetterella sp.]
MNNEMPSVPNYATRDDEKAILRAQLIGAAFPSNLTGKEIHPYGDNDVVDQTLIAEEVESELSAEGYHKTEDGKWINNNAASEQSNRLDNYATRDDEKAIRRAELIGLPFPESAYGKMISPIGDNAIDQAMITQEVEEELQSEGYHKADDGTWAK